jgi:hypothetical protein
MTGLEVDKEAGNVVCICYNFNRSEFVTKTFAFAVMDLVDQS